MLHWTSSSLGMATALCWSLSIAAPAHGKARAVRGGRVWMFHPLRFQQQMWCVSCRGKEQEREKDGKSSRQRSLRQEIHRHALEEYRCRFADALSSELNEEMEGMKERLREWSKQRLQDEGFTLFDLSVRPDGQLYRDQVFRFFYLHGNSGLLPSHHQFSQGDMVAISQKNPLDDEDTVIEGVVMERARRFLRVAVSTSQSKNLNVMSKWRLDLSANRVSYDRCMLAINCFTSPDLRKGFKGSIQLSASSVSMSNSSKNGTSPQTTVTIGEGAMTVRGLLLGVEEMKVKSKQKETMVGSSVLPESYVNSERLIAMKSPPSRISGKLLGAQKGMVRALLQAMKEDLNVSQKVAIESAMCQRTTLWQGPPGTGKTRTLVHFIASFCRSGQGQVLACADSNVAVDNLLEGLLEQGLRVVRVGQPVKVEEGLREVTMDAQVMVHPLMKKALQSRQAAISQRQEIRQINNSKRRISSARQATAMWDKAMDLEAQAIKSILDRADVVAATCVGAGDAILDGRCFHLCVIDEATQATEPACLIPIIRSGADSLVLVGDPAQLPPTVISQQATEMGLAVSLFEHLQQCGVKPLLLDTQYRMHPALAAWPSRMFYGGHLFSHPLDSDRPAPEGLWPNREKPILFVDCANGKEETTVEGNSWLNRSEASQVVKIVQLLLSCPDTSGDIGVIAPYSAQVRLLRELFEVIEKETKEKFPNLEVSTVDGFQGREKEVIVFSTVRCNEEKHLGFVMDSRRMNVAITRAKRGLVVVGNEATLSSSIHWRSWLQYMREEQLVINKVLL
ncbi:unnamed protein product [Sphagnum jensenii]|uniref:Uncharacterized protein n=2 Tax=Sphagnum jensenii TaxID=128206 RepID=A0ABP0ZWT8_9BRYO